MLVRIVKDWKYPSNFFRQVPGGSNQWGEVTFTEEDVYECDFLIVLQRPPYDVRCNCPEGNTWLITQEPPVSYFSFYKRAFPYFDRVFSYYTDVQHPNIQHLQPVLPWHVNKSYDELSAINIQQVQSKEDALSWITSNKNSWPGHKARMQFKDVLLPSSVPFHLMGNGFQPIADKFDGLFPYKYSLAIENYSCNHYWTEKLADCFLSWCLPFYWGAPNIMDYFPEDSLILIDPRQPQEAVEIIQKAIADNEWEKRVDAIKEARNLVLNHYQFFPYITKMIQEHESNHIKRVRKDYFIPANPYPRRYQWGNQLKYYSKRLVQALK